MDRHAELINVVDSTSNILDTIGTGIGDALKDNDLEFSMFGDSPVEEQQRPEADMIEDDLQIRAYLGAGRRAIEAFPVEARLPEDFSNVSASQVISDDFRIEYCIDGSLRTKYMGEIMNVSGEGGAPFIASHMGALAVKIDYSSGRVKPSKLALKLGLYVPAPGLIPDIAYQKIESLETRIGDLFVEPLGADETESELRSAAGGKVRNKMHDMEIDLINSLPETRGWLVIDGALRKEKFYNLPRAIAVAKSFSHKVIFSGNDGRRPRTISHLARMKPHSRSPIYRYRPLKAGAQGGDAQDLSGLVFWYLKLRTPPPEMEPLGGIVKVDMPYHGETAETLGDVADKLSSAVLDIANPSIFPRPRWPSFLYPIRVTEEYLGTMLYGANHFMRLGVMIRSAMSKQ